MRDLIYFDVEKAASLLSQLEGGLLKEIQDAQDTGDSTNTELNAGLAFIRAGLHSNFSDKFSRIETRILHHAMLNRLEETLFTTDLATDLNRVIDSPTPSPEMIHASLTNTGYLRAEGWAAIEDYARMASILDNFNSLVEVIGKSAKYSFEQTDAYKEMRNLIDVQKRIIEAERNKATQSQLRTELRKIEKQVNETLDNLSNSSNTKLPDWLINGIKLWISVFNPNQIHLRLFPFEETPGFQVLSNLKRSVFAPEELDHMLFCYGKRPNIKLTVFGLLTSIPSKDGENFDPMAEFDNSVPGSEMTESFAMEKGFRSAFAGLDSFDSLGRYQRWPNVTLYPIAVFRQLQPKKKGGQPAY